MTELFNILIRITPIRWQIILEHSQRMKGILIKMQLILFDGLDKERCIATHLFVVRILQRQGLNAIWGSRDQ